MKSWDGLSTGQFFARVAFAVAVTAAAGLAAYFAVSWLTKF